VYLPVMSIVEGTWGSGAAPEEFETFLLMREMHWSWDELQRTPRYVQRFCWDFVQLIFQKESDDAEAHRGG
jgi:hypothetical protein